jgi:hypothetical protein
VKHFTENAILAACIIIVLAFLILWVLMGCAQTKGVRAIDVLCVGNGGDVFHAHGVGAEVAGFTEGSWDMRNCDVTVTEEKGPVKR